MSSFNLRLPKSIHRNIKKIASQEGVSINQFIITAIAEKISALTTEDYLKQKAKKADKKAFKDILNKVPDREPIKGDEL